MNKMIFALCCLNLFLAQSGNAGTCGSKSEPKAKAEQKLTIDDLPIMRETLEALENDDPMFSDYTDDDKRKLIIKLAEQIAKIELKNPQRFKLTKREKAFRQRVRSSAENSRDYGERARLMEERALKH